MTWSRNQSTSDGVIDLTESERHRLFAAERRRIAIDVLTDRSAPVDLEELASAVAERESGVDATDDEAIEQVMITLHHVHLPMITDAGLIVYDLHESRVVSCPRSVETSIC